MPARRNHPRRSAAEWVVRGGLALVVAGLGYVSASHSLAYSVRGSAPERAYALAPWDGRLTALLSEKLSGPEVTVAERKRADTVARLALRQDPTAVSAVATLGINAQVRGDTATARRVFAYSEMLSRRDLRTRLWAIEDAVGRNDIPAILRNYDIALRTSRIAPDLLFPILVTAINVPDVRIALADTLAKQPAWGEQFIASVAGNAPDTRATADLFERLHRLSVALPASASAMLIGRLLTEGHSDVAWRYYATVTPGAVRSVSRDPNFTANLVTPTPFDWTPVIDSGISATIQRGDRGGLFDFAVPSSLSGPVLRQTQMLPPGKYQLEGHSIAIDQAADMLPYWTLLCGEGRELGRIAVPNSAQENGRFSGQFTVPGDCPVQQLTLVVRPSDHMAGSTGQIDDVRLRPMR